MATLEAQYNKGLEKAPTPGTLSHLEWLASVDLPPVTNSVELVGFFAHTKATRSLANFIRNHRTYRPQNMPTIDLDTRLYDLENALIPNFRGTIYRHPHYPERSYLTFRSGPHVWELPEDQSTYQFFIPVNYDFSYDSSRKAQASFRYTDKVKNAQREVYDQAAYPEYGWDNPQIMVKAVKQASADLLELMNHLYFWQHEELNTNGHHRFTDAGELLLRLSGIFSHS